MLDRDVADPCPSRIHAGRGRVDEHSLVLELGKIFRNGIVELELLFFPKHHCGGCRILSLYLCLAGPLLGLGVCGLLREPLY